MKMKDILVPNSLFTEHLQFISGIKFSRREIDIIAYIIGGRSTKKIAQLSGLSPRTVENYTRNIMIKIDCNSRESIIDFIEKSNKLTRIREHYSSLIGHDSHPNELFSSYNEQVHIPIPDNRAKWKWIIPFCTVVILFLGGSFIVFVEGNQERPSTSISSALITPTTSNLLVREDVLSQIEDGFKKNDGIQILALVGIGGSGKTTIARHYASLHHAPVVWEVNAETPDSLNNSFYELAQALSKSHEDAKLLTGLKEIKDPKDKEEKVFQFVKDRLKHHPNWLLIFDNVEKFSEVQPYFPHDAKIWGKGNILLTTTDSNIQTNPYVNKTIFINLLSPEEGLQLFEKVMTHGNNVQFSDSQRQEAKKFLTNIPALPLDISVAAYYLKATHVDYNQYLINLKKYNEKLARFQEKLLRETSDYNKTRFSIITLSAQQLIKENPEFVDLLTLVSLLDSGSIPRDLLDHFKSNLLVDDFIYNLKKYSLITERPNHTLQPPSTFSMHRNIQETCLGFLGENLDVEKNKALQKSIVGTLENYSSEAHAKEDIEQIKGIANHLNKFLSHTFLLTDKLKASLCIELGRAYFYLGHNLLAKEWLEIAVSQLNKEDPTYLRAQNYLGVVYRELGNYEKARDILEQTLSDYQLHDKENYKDIAWTSMHLGNIYRSLGNYEKARVILEKSLWIYNTHLPQNPLEKACAAVRLAYVNENMGNYDVAKNLLEQSLAIYNDLLPKDHTRTAWVLVHLGNIYSEIGEYEKAKTSIEKGLNIFNKHFSKDHFDIAWASVHLANVYRKLRNYEKAQSLLEKSYTTYQKFFKDDHPKMAWLYSKLGVLYKDVGQIDKSRRSLEKSLSIYEKMYGPSHLKQANVLTNLGQAYLLDNDMAKAENVLQKALVIYSAHQHFKRYHSLEALGDLFIKKSRLEKDNKQAHIYQEQALHHLIEAQEIIKSKFSDESLEWKNLDAKIIKARGLNQNPSL